jgi:hypothetical protein
MIKSRILNPSKSYTFSKYAELAYDSADILAELGVTLKNTPLELPQQLPIDPEPLRAELAENLTLVDPVSEIARREAVIFPILKTICKFQQAPLKIEYPVRVSNWLKGTFDYFILTQQNLLVVEAKNADVTRGFTQLAVELIALDLWTDSTAPMLYGAVTTGDNWKFGIFQRQEKIVYKDIIIYAIPNDLNSVLSILFGITLS